MPNSNKLLELSNLSFVVKAGGMRQGIGEENDRLEVTYEQQSEVFGSGKQKIPPRCCSWTESIYEELTGICLKIGAWVNGTQAEL